MTPIPQKPLAGRAAQIRAVGDPLNEAFGPFDVPLDRLTKTIAQARSHGPRADNIGSKQGPAWDRMYGDALDALDAFYATVRPALEKSRSLAAALADELAAEEQAQAEAEAEARRQAELEAKVQRGVQAEEAERLQAVEKKVRSRLAGVGRK